jgi:hypothetical protein
LKVAILNVEKGWPTINNNTTIVNPSWIEERVGQLRCSYHFLLILQLLETIEVLRQLHLFLLSGRNQLVVDRHNLQW